MPRTITSTIALSLLVASAGQASAAQWPVFDFIKITPDGIPPTVEVISEDGEKWTKVKNHKMTFGAVIDIKMKKGEISGLRVKHGNTIVFDPPGEDPDGPKHVKFTTNISTKSKNMALPATLAINACNAKLATEGGIAQDHFTGVTDTLELIVDAQTNAHSLTRTGTGEFPVTVKCIGVPKQVGPKPGANDNLAAVFGVKSASLLVREPVSNACPSKAKLTASFETNVAGKVTFIYRKAGGGKSAPITVSSKKRPNGKFIALHHQIVPIKEATNTKYMVEVVGKGVISDWKALNVPCKVGLGGGGEVATPPEVPMKAISAQIGIIGPKTKACPTNAKLTAWIRTNKAGKIGFRLMRKDGPFGPMIFATAVKSGNGYMATYTRKMAIAGPVDQAYAVTVPGSGGLASNFAPLKASCTIKLPGVVLGN